MAKLFVKIFTSESIIIDNVDLKVLSPHQLIDEMIKDGYLHGDTLDNSYFSILYKNNRKVALDKLDIPFEQLGFIDGDIIRIIRLNLGGVSGDHKQNRVENKRYIFARCFDDENNLSHSYKTFDTCPKYDYENDAYTKKEKQLYFETERLRIEASKIESEISSMQLSYEEKEFTIEERILQLHKEFEELLDSEENVLQRKIDEYNQKSYEYNKLVESIQEGGVLGEFLRITSDLFLSILGTNESVISDEEKIKKVVLELEQLQQEIKEIQERIYEIAKKSEYEYNGCIKEIENNKSAKERSIKIVLDKQRQLNENLKTKAKELAQLEKEKNVYNVVYGSIFAPAHVKRKSRMLIQVYLHLFEETEKVKSLAQESQKDAERRDYIPLQCKLKKGDKVDVMLNIYGESLLKTENKSVVWQGSFTKCSFDYFVPKDIDIDELSCVALLTVNNIPVGEMRFITKIVENPRQLNPEIISHSFSKVFVSYSHEDEPKVKFLHEGLELGKVPHFFDRKYLKTGDVFPQVIQDYINSADLFVLCWSENAAKSEYVEKERKQALERAFPQVKPQQAAKLSIYPMSIEPRAELPSDMKENYHFGEI